jgi:hypothetical protein
MPNTGVQQRAGPPPTMYNSQYTRQDTSYEPKTKVLQSLTELLSSQELPPSLASSNVYLGTSTQSSLRPGMSIPYTQTPSSSGGDTIEYNGVIYQRNKVVNDRTGYTKDQLANIMVALGIPVVKGKKEELVSAVLNAWK